MMVVDVKRLLRSVGSLDADRRLVWGAFGDEEL
jgi:hypothetical protein